MGWELPAFHGGRRQTERHGSLKLRVKVALATDRARGAEQVDGCPAFRDPALAW